MCALPVCMSNILKEVSKLKVSWEDMVGTGVWEKTKEWK